jgi:hypothetical protein
VNGISLGEDSCGLVNKKFLRIEDNTIARRGVRSPLISVGWEMLIYELQRGGITHEYRSVLSVEYLIIVLSNKQ